VQIKSSMKMKASKGIEEMQVVEEVACWGESTEAVEMLQMTEVAEAAKEFKAAEAVKEFKTAEAAEAVKMIQVLLFEEVWVVKAFEVVKMLKCSQNDRGKAPLIIDSKISLNNTNLAQEGLEHRGPGPKPSVSPHPLGFADVHKNRSRFRKIIWFRRIKQLFINE